MKRSYLTLLLFGTLLLSSCSFIPMPSSSSQETSSSEESSSSESSSSEASSELSSEESSSEEASSSEVEPFTGYYAPIDPLAEGNDLLGQVRELITTTHTKYTSYGDNRGGDKGKTDQTDYDPTNPNRIIMFYTKASIPNMWDNGTTYNREHVWCQSLTNGLWGESYGGADMHHIRPIFSSINSARGNKPYAEITNGTPKTHIYDGVTYTGGTYNSSYWEPNDDTKGDIARILLYCFVHYNTPTNLAKNNTDTSAINTTTTGSWAGDLPLTKVVKGSKQEAFNLLVKWHNNDPVDIYETNRNDAVYTIQKNRNPFIDHPEFVNAIWG